MPLVSTFQKFVLAVPPSRILGGILSHLSKAIYTADLGRLFPPQIIGASPQPIILLLKAAHFSDLLLFIFYWIVLYLFGV